MPNNLRRELGDEIAELRLALIVRCLRRGRLGEFLEARIIPQWIEHWIEPEQRGSCPKSFRSIVSARATFDRSSRARGRGGYRRPGGYRPFILSVTRKIALRIASETRACYGP